jgi:lipoprotein-anchoring transpeptidase ErfK/SrfK
MIEGFGDVVAEAPDRAGVSVERFEWIAATSKHVLLRLAGTCRAPESGGLLVLSRLLAASDDSRREELRLIHQELDLAAEARPPIYRWSCAFSAPSELMARPGARFVLELGELGFVSLPEPTERRLAKPAKAVRPAAPGVLSRASRRASGILLGAGIGTVVGLGLWGIVTLIEGGGQQTVKASSATVARNPGPPAAPVRAVAVPPGESLVAEARGKQVAIYPSADASAPKTTLSNPNPDGAPLVFLVATVKGGRLQVLLPTRPNLSRGWISASAVRLVFNPYRLEVHLSQHQLTIWRSGRLVQRYPVGVGRRAVTPTPAGLYYITELLKQPDPGGEYGPYAFGISAHSNVLHEFAGGNGEIGIHGTNQPWLVGGDVSHGCIRVRNDVVTRLANELPLGTPVQIAR